MDLLQSSGSRSGSGSRTGEVLKPKSGGVVDINNASGSTDGSGSSDGSENGSSRLNVQGGSDNGSGNQVSGIETHKSFMSNVFASPD